MIKHAIRLKQGDSVVIEVNGVYHRVTANGKDMVYYDNTVDSYPFDIAEVDERGKDIMEIIGKVGNG